MEVGERLQKIHHERGEPLREVANKTGIVYTHLSCWETGAYDWRKMTAKKLMALADYYGVSVDYLLCREEQKNDNE